MKNIKTKFILVLLMLASSIILSQTNNETPIALIKKIIKDVKYKATDASDWDIAKTGSPLKSGEQIKTGVKSLALVLFTDGTGLLRVRENSTMYIYGKREGKKTNKNTFIEKGLIGFDINKQDAEEFKFTTPTAVAAIRGTSGYLLVESDSTTTVVCEHGKIEVKSLVGAGRTGFVEGGKVITIDADGKLEKRNLSIDEKDLYKKTKVSKTKKVLIETEDGTLEFEFYPEEDN
jgi:hypothetical protein